MAKKKEKITYIDDGRSIADMSDVQGGFSRYKRPEWEPHPKAKEIWKTYWAAVKLMVKPMLVVVGGLILIYMILYFLFSII